MYQVVILQILLRGIIVRHAPQASLLAPVRQTTQLLHDRRRLRSFLDPIQVLINICFHF